MNKLSAEQQELLDTQFPAEMEKEAAAQAALISDLYSTGFSKLASAACDEMDEKEKEEEKEEHHKKPLEEKHEKEASDRGAFIARGYIDGLMKEGSERHDDELHYLYPFIAEKLAVSTKDVKKMYHKAVKAGKKGLESAKKTVSEGAEKAKEGVKSYGRGIKEDFNTMMDPHHGMKKITLHGKGLGHKGQKVWGGEHSTKDRIMAGGKVVAKTLGPAAGLGLAGYGVHKATKKKEE